MKKNYCPGTWFLTVIFSFFLINLVQGQEYNVVNLLPPAPNAASLGKFAGVNTGLSSGTANFSIPLFNYTSKNISVPVSVSYTTSGFKVDEIASRVGNQWALNAGGVITRTVLGSVDETSNRIHPKPSLGETTESNLFLFEIQLSNTNPLQGVGPGGAVDGQPDMFSFNFDKYSGKFILDTIGVNHTLQPVMLSNSGLKIEKTSALTFIITTPEGVQYVFGGADATEQTENVSCGSPYTKNLTAWYLKQIIHPNGDAATFYYSPLVYSYRTGISQTIYKRTGPGVVYTNGCNFQQSQVNAPSPTPYFCSNFSQTTGVLLDSITSTHGGKVKFDYVARDDNNDRLVSAISLYSPDRSAVVKTFNFGYAYSKSRPFLTSLTEANGAAAVLAKHKFGYIDMGAIPAALSYAQDYWGYYNGKTSNSTSIPKPDDPGFQQNLPEATADRHPDPVYAQKGLLNSVTYPTGGKDSVVYEGNQSYQMTTVYPEDQLLSFTGTNNTGSNNPTPQISTTTAVISVSQQVTFSGNCTALVTTPNSTRMATIEITDVNNNVIDNAAVQPGATFSKTRILDPGTYKVAVILWGDHVKSRVSLKYFSGVQTTQEMNRDIGGVRVAKILTYDGVSANPIIKKYNYNKWSAPTQSSAETINIPYYERNIKLWVQCTGGGLCYDGIPFDFATSSSSSAYNLFVTPTPATYANVTESFGENFENGGVEHQFTKSQDKPATVFKGEAIYGAPNGNQSYKNGLETYQSTFKIQGGLRIYSQKTYTHYLEDTTFAKRFIGYIGTQNYPLYCTGVNTDYALFYQRRNYNTSYYFIDKAWIYADTVRTQVYDLSGSKYTQNITAYEYNNVDNAQPTAVTNYASNGAVLKTTFSYPSDYAVTPYTTMVGKHILSPVIIKTNYKNTTPLQSIRTNYSDWGSNIFAPLTVETRLGTAAYEARLHYFGYDNMGNVLSVSKESGPKTAYVWGYNGLYPVAKLENAEYSAVSTALGGAAAIQTFRNKPKPTAAELGAYLAPLRTNTGLKSALVITNSFDPVNGLSATTDAKGQSTTYEYDPFQRLMNIKDKDGNVVKSFTYHYQGQ